MDALSKTHRGVLIATDIVWALLFMYVQRQVQK